LNKSLPLAIWGSFFLALFMTAAESSCLNPNADTRLRTFCVAETLAGNTVTLGDAMFLDASLKREGFGFGLGLPNSVPQTTSQPHVSPVLEYNSNINGGNPDRSLILGELVFEGDDENVRREGFLAGIAVGLSGRSIYGNGDYFDYAMSASYAHSPEHEIGVARAGVNVCSRNNVREQWYIDACANSFRLVRDLAAETTSGLSLTSEHLFAASNGAFHSLSYGIRRHYAEEYKQNQLQLGLSTVRNAGAYTSFDIAFGEAVENTLAMRKSLSATIGTTLAERPFTVTASYSHSNGGKLLGFDRSDTTRIVSLNYGITQNFSVSIGYKWTDSSISYFSEREPLVSVQFAPIRF
jgi:hypothetical protein